MITEAEMFSTKYPGFGLTDTLITYENVSMSIRAAFTLIAFHGLTLDDIFNELRYAFERERISWIVGPHSESKERMDRITNVFTTEPLP